MRIPPGAHGTLTPGIGIYETSSDPRHRIGETFRDDTRTFVYGQAATTIAAGLLCCPDQSVLGSENMLAEGGLVAFAAGTVRADQDVCTANLLVGQEWIALYHASSLDNWVENCLTDGYICLSDSAGVDQIYEVKWNSAIYDQGSTDIVAIQLKDPIRTSAADGTTEITFIQIPGKELQLFATGTDDNPIGAPQVAVADNYYAWFQCWGYGMGVSASDTAFNGSALFAKDTGALELQNDDSALPVVAQGLCNVTGAGDAMLVNWQIMR